MAKQTIGIGTTANDGTGDALRTAFDKVNDNFDEVYADDFVTAARIADNTITNALMADDAIDSAEIADGAIDTVHIADDQVTHAKLEARYTEVQDISSTTSPIDLECDDYAAFNLTGNLGTVTLNLNDLKTGQAVDILLSGSDLSSAVITLADNFTTSTINKVGTNDLDTSGTNMIQIVCIDDTDSDAILNYAIATYTSDTTP